MITVKCFLALIRETDSSVTRMDPPGLAESHRREAAATVIFTAVHYERLSHVVSIIKEISCLEEENTPIIIKMLTFFSFYCRILKELIPKIYVDYG